jgi:hypothetical protein
MSRHLSRRWIRARQGALGGLVVLLAGAAGSAGLVGPVEVAAAQGSTASTTTVTITDANPGGAGGNPVVGDTVTFGVVVTDASGSATVSPSNVVDIHFQYDDGSMVCRAALAPIAGSSPMASTGSCQAALADAGSDTFYAVYNGDTTFAPSEGTASLPIAVASASTTTVVVPIGPAPTVGLPFAFSASVLASSPGASAAPTGTVTFLDNGIPITSCLAAPLSPGATVLVPSTVGCSFVPTIVSNALTASYSGDASDGASVSLEPAVVIASAAVPGLTLAVSTMTPAAGDVVTVLATFSGAPGVVPTQSVGVDVSVNGGSPTLLTACDDQILAADETASCSFTVTSTEPLEFTASYAGDAGYGAASAVPLDVAPVPATPSIALSTGAIGPVAGSSDSVTALVTGSPVVGAPTGAITVSKGLTVLSCGSPVTVGDTESVTCPVTYVAAGLVSFRATVAADSQYSTATATAEREIGLATPAVAVSASGAAVGSTVSVVAVVTGEIAITAAPAGTINVYANASHLQGCTVSPPSGDSARVTCSYTYTSTVPVTFSAHVGADANYAAASGGPIVEIASRAPDTASLATFTAKPEIGSALSLSAKLTGPKSGALFSGQFEFYVSTGPGVPFSLITTCGQDGFVAVSTIGTSQCSTSAASTTETFYVSYLGDANYLSSKSPVLAPVIVRAPVVMQITKLASASPIFPGTYVHLLVTVTGGPGVGSSPGGTLAIFGPPGAKCASSCKGDPLHSVSGTEAEAQFAISFSSSGVVTVRITYSGSALFLPASDTLLVAIVKPTKKAVLLGAAG